MIGNKGFYYSSYDKQEGIELSEYTDRHKLYYHELNTDQKSDKTVFGDQREKYRYVSGNVSDDNNFLFISASNQEESAFTTETPTPCKPPETL